MLKNLVPSFKTCQRLVEAGVVFEDSIFVWDEIYSHGKTEICLNPRGKNDNYANSRFIAAAPLVGEMGEWLQRNIAIDKPLVFSYPVPSIFNERIFAYREIKTGLWRKFSTEAEARANMILEVKGEKS